MTVPLTLEAEFGDDPLSLYNKYHCAINTMEEMYEVCCSLGLGTSWLIELTVYLKKITPRKHLLWRFII